MRSIMLAVALVASLSSAQQKKPDLPVQKIDFTGGGAITAERGTPLAEIYLHPPRARFDCLIQVRMNMNDKLRESVHEM